MNQPNRADAEPRVVVTDAALNDFCRFFGLPLEEAARSELAREFASARFVRRQKEAEIWRGRRPRRIQFVVFPQADGRMVVANLHSPISEWRLHPVARRVSIRTDEGLVEFTALDMVLEPGGERRVTYKKAVPDLELGHVWLTGRRGAKLDEIVGTFVETEDPPDWARPHLKE